MDMLGTLMESQKSDWKTYLPSMSHAYNATRHSSTRLSPFYLMFGRHPRLAIDVCLGLDFPEREVAKDKSKYIQALRQGLSAAY